MSAVSGSVSLSPGRRRLADFVALTKPRITFLVVLTALVGFVAAGSGAWNLALLLRTLAGTALVAGAASALNQWA